MSDDTFIEGPLYEKRRKVYPQSVHGPFRRIKWAILCVTLGIYYLLPFVRWNRGPRLLRGLRPMRQPIRPARMS